MSVANSAIMHFRTFLRDCSLQCFEAMTQSKGEVRVVPCGAVCRQYVSGPVSGGSAVDWARKGTGATSSRPFSPRSGTTAACEDHSRYYSSECEKDNHFTGAASDVQSIFLFNEKEMCFIREYNKINKLNAT